MNKSENKSAYGFTVRESYERAESNDLLEFAQGVRRDVVPKIRDQIKQKEEGAQRVRRFKIF